MEQKREREKAKTKERKKRKFIEKGKVTRRDRKGEIYERYISL